VDSTSLPNDLLPLYYARQAVEQIFGIGKNNADLIPLRVYCVEAFRIMINQKCKVFDETIVPQEPNKAMVDRINSLIE